MPSIPRRLLRSASDIVRALRTGRGSVRGRLDPAYRSERRRRSVPRPIGMSAAEYEAYQLFALGEAGVTRVRLRAGTRDDTPAACTETDGFEMTLDEAMLLRPIPHEVGRGEECRCAYRPAGH